MSQENSLDISKLIANPGKGMILDGIIGGAQIDSSGEILDVEGADTSSLISEGVLNWEHKSGDTGTALDVVGRCVFVKKIFKASDCEDNRQKEYFDAAKKTPIIYAKFRLFDGSGHQPAMACAAMIRDMLHAGEKIIARYSVEGSTVEKDGNVLKRTIVRNVALTLKPCNKASLSGVVADPNGPPLPKGSEEDPLGNLENVEKFEHPAFSLLTSYHSSANPVVFDPVNKALEAGSYNAAPGSLTGGAALQREEISGRVLANNAKAALRDYNWQRKEAGREDFKKFLKYRLPEADDSFIDRFADMVDGYRLHKAEPAGKKGSDKKSKKPSTKAAKSKPYNPKLPEQSKKGIGPVAPLPKPKAAKASKNPEGISVEPKSKVERRIIAPDVLNPHLNADSVSLFGTVTGGRDEFGVERGVPKKASESYLDPETGYLHTDMGSFKVHIPDRDSFMAILNSPRVQHAHDDAMRHWLVLNKLAMEGRLPPEVIMAGALFSGQSPSVAVHMQEYAYSHLIDMINRGMDPTAHPGQPGAPSLEDRKEYIRRTGTGGPLPDFRHDYWAGPGGNVTRIGMSDVPDFDSEDVDGEDQEGLPKAGKVGQQKGLLYPKQKFTSVEQYYKLHQFLVNALQEHRGDARTVAHILMDNKAESEYFKGKAARSLKWAASEAVRMGMGSIQNDENGKPIAVLTPEGQKWVKENSLPSYFEATGNADAQGYAPKTTRYLLAMLGAGNVLVPDTHFIRHIFGLPTDKMIHHYTREMLGRDFQVTDKYKEEPFGPNEMLKRILWNEKNSHILDSLDKYYMENHPAYDYVVDRFFGGRRTEQALFPAFWAHWLSVAPDEERMGQQNQSFNTGTDHKTYWLHVEQLLKKYGLQDEWDHGLKEFDQKFGKAEGKQQASLLHRVAMAHNDMHNALGPAASSLFYFSKLVPLLLREAAKNGTYEDPNGEYFQKPQMPSPMVMKLEATTIDLKKAMDALEKVPKAYVFGGRSVLPGEINLKMNGWLTPHALLGETPDDYIVARYDPWTSDKKPSGSSFRVSKKALRPEESVVTPHQNLDTGLVLDGDRDTLPDFTIFPEQKQLVHGLDLGADPEAAPGTARKGINGFQSAWRKGPTGMVYVKAPPPDHEEFWPDFKDARREGLYHNIARGFFGLGHYLPTTAVIKHRNSGDEYAVVQGVPGRHISIEPLSNPIIDPNDHRHDIHYKIDDDHQRIITDLGDSGELHKLLMMNYIMGNHDRHSGNFMLNDNPPDGKAKLTLLDHGRAIAEPQVLPAVSVPDYMRAYHGIKYNRDLDGGASRIMHPEAVKWLQSLDPKELELQLMKHGLPKRYLDETVARLTRAQNHLKDDPNSPLYQILGKTLDKHFFTPTLLEFGGYLKHGK